MENTPSKDDLAQLESLYLAAISDADKIEWEDHYPVYPDSVKEFFGYITSSAWCNRNYKPTEASKLLSRLSKASLIDIQSILTSSSRSERFCSGAWREIVAEDKLSSVIARAKEIV